MSTSLFELRDEMKDEVVLYKTPIVYNDALYNKIITKAAKQYYIDTGQESNWSTQYSIVSSTPTLSVDLTLTQREYVVVWGQIIFIKQIQSDVAKLVSYSTDSLSITQGDKPYKYLGEDIKELNNRLLELFYKIGSDITSMTPVTSITITELDVNYE